MTQNIFFASDYHFGHTATCTVFKGPDGVTPLRPFANAQEMDEEMIRRHNEVVKPSDKLYVLGDCAMKKEFLPLLGRLNGSKRLIRGNHDVFAINAYRQYFTEIYGVRVLEDMILSHIPLHPDCVTKRFRTNVHGHTHGNYMHDPAYMCVCVEWTNFAPISLEDLRLRIAAKKEWYANNTEDMPEPVG
jgi:calcineurin-like phosphoesterase family protein